MNKVSQGQHVASVMQALQEFGKITAQELSDYADISLQDAHAVLNRMKKPNKTGPKRVYISEWVYQHDNLRRYPRAVFMLGTEHNKLRPKPDLRLNRRRSEANRNTPLRMNNVFNMALSREKIREIRKSII